MESIDFNTEARVFDGTTAGEVDRLRRSNVELTLADVVATDDPAVHAYVRTKRRRAEKLGVRYKVFEIAQDMSTEHIVQTVTNLNEAHDVQGVMISTPMFAHLNPESIISAINPIKDVDGLTPTNVGYLASNQEHLALIPATALAAIHVVELLKIPLNGKHVVVLGRGRTVGRPVSQLAINRHATVTVCHSHSRDLARYTRTADVLIVATGKPRFVGADLVRDEQIVVDCGIAVEDGKVFGDVDYLAVAPRVKYLSPVPGGVGVLTSSMLYANLLRAVTLQSHSV